MAKLRIDRRAPSLEQSSGIFKYFNSIPREQHLKQIEQEDERLKEHQAELAEIQETIDRERAQMKHEKARQRKQKQRAQQKQKAKVRRASGNAQMNSSTYRDHRHPHLLLLQLQKMLESSQIHRHHLSRTMSQTTSMLPNCLGRRRTSSAKSLRIQKDVAGRGFQLTQSGLTPTGSTQWSLL